MAQINSPSSGYVQTSLLNMYYDIEGQGPPLLLLHGGLCTADTFSLLRTLLNDQWTTIAVEQQGHGHTADVSRPLRFEQMAADTASVLDHLNLEGCHAFGWSDGGNVALALALHHPNRIDRIAICGTNADNDGLNPAVLKQMHEGLSGDPEKVAASMPEILRKAYEGVAPDSKNWPILVQRVFEQAVSFKGWTDDQLRSVKSAVLVMVGDQDVVPVSHAHKLFDLFRKSQLSILPGTDHLAPVTRAEWIAPILNDFFSVDLDAPLPMSKGK